MADLPLESSVNRRGRRSVSNAAMYGDMASALGIAHLRVAGELAAGCNLHKDALGCNMSVSVPRLLNAVDASVALVRGP